MQPIERDTAVLRCTSLSLGCIAERKNTDRRAEGWARSFVVVATEKRKKQRTRDEDVTH